MTNVDTLMAYEDGSLSEADALDMFADLISTGMAWRLQGSYGRAANALIEQGYISPEGEVLVATGP
jgi:hypothetical protein